MAWWTCGCDVPNVANKSISWRIPAKRSQAEGALPAVRDPRLSEAGNQVWKRVGLLLDVLGRMEVWLAHHGRTGLTPEDRVILSPRFQRLARDAGSVAALSQDFVGELEHA